MKTKTVTIDETQIVVDRQSLLDVVRALDMGVNVPRLPMAMDALREPFFSDEISSGTARSDFTANRYEVTE